MFREVSQFMNFKRLQFTMSSGSKTSQLQWSEFNSFQSQNLVTNSSHQTANFTVLAFLKFHLQNRTLTFAAMNMDITKLKEAFSEVHAFTKLLQRFGMRNSGDMTTIAANHLKTRMSQSLSQVAVIRDQQHPLSHLIEPTDGKHSLFGSRHQIDGFGTSLRVMVGTQKTLGLVDQKVAKSRHPQAFGIQSHILFQWIDRSSRVSHHFSIDGDSPRANVLFTFTARINTGHGQKLLQPHAIAVFARLFHFIGNDVGRNSTAA
jgi:hypothetical protein